MWVPAILLLLQAATSSSYALHGRVETIRLHSRALGVDKNVTIYLPPSYDTSTRHYPSIYYLHGSGGSERSWLDRFHMDVVADSLIATGLPEAVIVMPDGDTGYWTDWASPTGFADRCATDSLLAVLQESAATWCVQHGRYEMYVVSEIVPSVDSRFRTRRSPHDRAIAGNSMGGYGAFFLALRHPELWGAAVSHSGVLQPLYVGPHPYGGHPIYAVTVDEVLATWEPVRRRLFAIQFGSDTATWWARDPFRQLERLLREGRPLPALSFDVGSSDRFADQSRALADTLTRRGIEHRFDEWPGGHDWTYWRAHAPAALAWLMHRFTAGRE